MNIRAYLPSAQLMLMVGSLALAAGLIYAAHFVTAPATLSSASVDTLSTAPDNSNWEAALAAIEAQSGTSPITAPSQQDVDALLTAAQTQNITESVGRSLLINLNSAKSQGLGDDIPTQNQILAQAQAQLANQKATSTKYSNADLTIAAVSNTTLHAYGNAVMQTLAAYPAASEKDTFLAIDYAVEGGDKNQGEKLASIGAAYKQAAMALLIIPVPKTLAPLHLEMVNNLLNTAATYDDMVNISSDPLRGLVGLQSYESYMDEGARVFTNIAQTLNKDDILFTKDEPGSAWSGFLSP